MKNEIQKKHNSEVAIYNKEEFVKKFEPMNMMKEFRSVNSIVKAVDSEVNSMAVQRKNYGEDTILAMIELHLLALNQSINVHEKLSPMQMVEISLEIVENYYFISFVEIAFVLKRAKSGYYGKINYSLNMPDVLSWFSQYAEERCQHFMNRSESKGIEAKQQSEHSSVMHEKVIEQLTKFKETLETDEHFNEEDYLKWRTEYINNNDKDI